MTIQCRILLFTHHERVGRHVFLADVILDAAVGQLHSLSNRVVQQPVMVSHLSPLFVHDNTRSRRQIVLQKHCNSRRFERDTTHPSLPDEADSHALFLVEDVEPCLSCNLLHLCFKKRPHGEEDAGEDVPINLAEEVALIFSWVGPLEQLVSSPDMVSLL